jgi:hypothetical protein
VNEPADRYQPSFDPTVIARLEQWHERAYRQLIAATTSQSFQWHGLELVIPPGVFPPVSADPSPPP